MGCGASAGGTQTISTMDRPERGSSRLSHHGSRHGSTNNHKENSLSPPLFPPPTLSPRQMMATPTGTPQTARPMRSGIGAFTMPMFGDGSSSHYHNAPASVISRHTLSVLLHQMSRDIQEDGNGDEEDADTARGNGTGSAAASFALLPSSLIHLILDYHIISRIVLAGGRFSSGSTATTRPLSLHPFVDKHWMMGPAAPVMRPDLPHLTYHHPSQAIMMIAGSQWDASDASWHLSIHDLLVDEDASSLWFAKSWDDPHHFLSLYRRNAASVVVPHATGNNLHLIGGEVTMMYLSTNNHIFFDGNSNIWKKLELGMESDGRTGATAAYCKDTNMIYLAGGHTQGRGVGDRIWTSSACFHFDLNEPHRGWRELRWSMRTERFKARSIIIDRQWYILGGTRSREEDVKTAYSPGGSATPPATSSSEPTVWLSSIERYDPVISRWHEADFSLPLPLGGFALLQYEQWLIVCGGFTTFTPSGLSSKCWAIDTHKLSGNLWLPLPDLPSPIADMACCVID